MLAISYPKNLALSFVFDFEIERSVENKGHEDTHMNTDDMRPKIRHNIKVTQRSIYAEIQGSTKATDDPIQDEIAKTKIEFFYHQKRGSL